VAESQAAGRRLSLEIFIHMDAAPRDTWTGDMDARPLTELGWRQAERIAADILAKGRVDALLSSPALRATQSLEPLSKQTGLPVEVTPGFGDTFRYKAPEGWENPDRQGPDPLGGAYSAGKALAEFEKLLARESVQRAVLCSYDDIVPAFLALVAGKYGVAMPKRIRGKGYFYVVEVAGDQASLKSTPAPDDFPA
jgi:hypothetical protein